MISINGKQINHVVNQTITALLEQQDYSTKKIVVELNGSIIQPTHFETTIIQNNDHLELISFVGGG